MNPKPLPTNLSVLGPFTDADGRYYSVIERCVGGHCALARVPDLATRSGRELAQFLASSCKLFDACQDALTTLKALSYESNESDLINRCPMTIDTIHRLRDALDEARPEKEHRS